MDKSRNAFIRELQNWEGVKFHFDEARRKHNRVTLTYNGLRRFVVYSKTASDYRAVMNQISDLRRICRSMGAERKGQVA